MTDQENDRSDERHSEDLSMLAALEKIQRAQRGVIPIALLPEPLQEAFENLHPFSAYPVIDGQICINAGDWVMFSAKFKNETLLRMRKRSLRMAWDGPTADDLEQAPVLSHWLTVIEPHFYYPALMGHAPDHPICVGDLIVTSRLCGLCTDGTWARTISRWYRLEQPATVDAFMERNASKVKREAIHPLRTRDALLIAAWEQVEEVSL
jgi:hypothetical protein